MRHMLAGIVLALAPTSIHAQAGLELPTYRALKPIALPDGRWDLLSVDAVHHRVLIARGDNVTIVDLGRNQARSVGSILRGHAAVAIDGIDLIAVTSGGDDSVRLIDGPSGRETGRIAVRANPDAAFYDPASRRLIVTIAKGGSVSVVDPRAMRLETTVPVKPGLEPGVLIGPGLLAINNEDANEIEIVDLGRGAALSPVALTGCEGPTGIAFDQAEGLLLSACANGKAALVDTRSRRLIELLPIVKGPDGALFDRQRRRFLVPCGQSGTLSVFAVDRGRRVTPLAAISTAVGARTAALDQLTGRVYLPAATFAPSSTGGRPAAVAGTAHLIVLEPTSKR